MQEQIKGLMTRIRETDEHLPLAERRVTAARPKIGNLQIGRGHQFFVELKQDGVECLYFEDAKEGPIEVIPLDPSDATCKYVQAAAVNFMVNNNAKSHRVVCRSLTKLFHVSEDCLRDGYLGKTSQGPVFQALLVAAPNKCIFATFPNSVAV